MDCSDLFRAVPTDLGICCAFNLASDSFNNTTGWTDYSRQEEKDRTLAGGKAEPGRRNGLTVLLDQHSNQKSFGSINQDNRGIQVTVILFQFSPIAVISDTLVTGMLSPGVSR